MLSADILEKKRTHFVLWHPKPTAAPPVLVLGEFQAGNPPSLINIQRFPLQPVDGFDDLFAIEAWQCGLNEGWVYYYFFETPDGSEQTTDPLAYTVDWRLLSNLQPLPFTTDDRQPAAVIKYRGGQLVACDPGGEESDFFGDPSPATLPANNKLVIYEMPTAWSKVSEPTSGTADDETGVGTFRDVMALLDSGEAGANFDDLEISRVGTAYLPELGINALELLPPADSFFHRDWGYDTAHFLAPDYELGFPEGFDYPTANTDLTALVRLAHQNGMRFFVDVVMAFAKNEPYQTLNLDDFYIINPAAHLDDPDSHNSRGTGIHHVRDGFGSTLFRYARFVTGYDPISGQQTTIAPARQLMYTYLTRWMRDFRIDGIRMDSVENVSNWDFVQGFKNRARELFQERCLAAGMTQAEADERFLVVGEELSLPMELLTQSRLDGLWNDKFRELVRSVILAEGDPASFEANVRRMVDCRSLGFRDGSQAVNYITTHDVEGFRRERLYNYLMSASLSGSGLEKRFKLAFVCLLTSVGIPMILAGEEFGDEHTRFDRFGNVTQDGGKQVDPVNYGRLEGDSEPAKMRRRILTYVSRLVKLRTSADALSVNDNHFIHVDFNTGKRVLAWTRGAPGMEPVVVVANFSDFSSGGDHAEYVVHNWPATPVGKQWREVTQDRTVPPEWIGREPLFEWEAKVYTTF
ncbi:MAG: alpha-amylase family glycosyl hydrolase [Acidobacteriota bacterium]